MRATKWRITRWTAGTSNSTAPTGGLNAWALPTVDATTLKPTNATGQRLRAWRNYPEPKVVELNGWTIDGAKAGPAFRALAGQVKTKIEALGPDAAFPLTLVLDGGEEVIVESEHVKRVQRTETVAGEWFIPHVVEPAFGIDRIIWHLLDHAYEESGTGEDLYVRMGLHPDVAPIDAAVLPFSKRRAWTPWPLRFIAHCVEFGVFWRPTTEADPSGEGTPGPMKSVSHAV